MIDNVDDFPPPPAFLLEVDDHSSASSQITEVGPEKKETNKTTLEVRSKKKDKKKNRLCKFRMLVPHFIVKLLFYNTFMLSTAWSKG